jgi:hypothetical protein
VLTVGFSADSSNRDAEEASEGLRLMKILGGGSDFPTRFYRLVATRRLFIHRAD